MKAAACNIFLVSIDFYSFKTYLLDQSRQSLFTCLERKSIIHTLSLILIRVQKKIC